MLRTLLLSLVVSQLAGCALSTKEPPPIIIEKSTMPALAPECDDSGDPKPPRLPERDVTAEEAARDRAALTRVTHKLRSLRRVCGAALKEAVKPTPQSKG